MSSRRGLWISTSSSADTGTFSRLFTTAVLCTFCPAREGSTTAAWYSTIIFFCSLQSSGLNITCSNIPPFSLSQIWYLISLIRFLPVETTNVLSSFASTPASTRFPFSSIRTMESFSRRTPGVSITSLITTSRATHPGCSCETLIRYVITSPYL